MPEHEASKPPVANGQDVDTIEQATQRQRRLSARPTDALRNEPNPQGLQRINSRAARGVHHVTRFDLETAIETTRWLHRPEQTCRVRSGIRSCFAGRVRDIDRARCIGDELPMS
jgi:hypothetical protein